MANGFAPSDFNKRVQFGTVGTVENINTGGTKKEFKPTMRLWYAAHTRTMTQQYQLLNTSLQGTIMITIRHNKSVTEQLLAKLNDDDQVYKVVAVSSDDSNHYLTYDLVTLQKTDKLGMK